MKYEDGKYYLVYNRGANRQDIFLTPENYEFCIRLMKKYLQHYRVSIMAFWLMPNHYHFLLRQNESGSISRFVQTVFNSYAQALNKMTGRSGTLFQGRAKGIQIKDDLYAVRLCQYIHHNPVAAGLVKMPADWKYSDYPDWVESLKSGVTDLSLRDAYYKRPEEYKRLTEEYIVEKEISKFAFEDM